MILVTEFMDEPAVDRLRRAHPVTYDPGLADRQGDIPALMAGVRALIVRNRTQVRDALLDAATDLTCSACAFESRERPVASALRRTWKG